MFKFWHRRDVLTSITDIGLIRSNNEDCVITLKHPSNKKIKLLAVADGIGGNQGGEIASNFVINYLKDWFIKEDINTFTSTKIVAQNLHQTIIDINNDLYLKEATKTYCGTTLTCAIVTETDTIIANIGDSRAYAFNEHGMKQLTKDDSVVWFYYEEGKLSKDDLRFHSQNNLITKCIGHTYGICPTVLTIPNDSYNGLLLLTDGVTDCLSDNKIKFIVDNHNGKSIANKLINEAVYHKQEEIIPSGIAFRDIKNGKDNASVALYIKYS